MSPEELYGLYYPDGSFRSKDEIGEQCREDASKVTFHTPFGGEEHSFDWWTDTMQERQDQRLEALGGPNYVQIHIDTDSPVKLCFIGDVHAGGDHVDYERFHNEIEYIKNTPNTYVALVGDLADSFFFTPAVHGQIANIEEQQAYLKSALNEIKGKVLWANAGNHDMWASRMGGTMYQDFTHEMQAHYFEGVGYVDLSVGQQTYRIISAHRHNGFSMYNSAHPSLRLMQDEAGLGADIAVTGHMHRKGMDVQTVNEFGGGAHMICYASLGAYKYEDEYGNQKGISWLSPEQMGGFAFILDPHVKDIQPDWNII